MRPLWLAPMLPASGAAELWLQLDNRPFCDQVAAAGRAGSAAPMSRPRWWLNGNAGLTYDPRRGFECTD